MSFADLGLGPEILKAVEEVGYVSPTPIQEQAIPTILMGRDVLGVAQTGTGKTAGFTLPMIEILAGSRAKARMPRSLILAPTRELATQVADNFESYGKYHKLSMAKLIGGESFADQEKLLDRGVDVLIATPGRLIDLFERGRILLNDVKILVIDEADRMLDMGFIPDVERIVSLLPKIRQTLFFSATMAPEIRRLADAFLMNPKEISVAPQSSPAAETVEQFLVVCDELDKRESLRHMLRSEEVQSAFIFCNRKRDVDILYRSLAKHGFDVVQLHGDMAQSARTETLEKFRRGEARLMVCSDVAARGIDITDLSHVFNFDVPHHAEDYVHRIGRTGRAGKSGRAFSIATPDDGKTWSAIVKLIGRDVPRFAIEGLPELALDPEGTGRRRGAGSRGRKPARPERTERPGRSEQPERSERAERPERAERGERMERPERNARPQREERDQVPRSPRPERTDRNDRGDRRRDKYHRGRRDEFGIGEMNNPDNTVGFGEHVPDFMLHEVVLPPSPPPRRKGEEDTDFDIEIDIQGDAVRAVEEAPAAPVEVAQAAPAASDDVPAAQEGPSQPEDQATADAKPKTKTRAKPKAKTEAKPKAKAAPKGKEKAEAETKPKPKPRSRAKAKAPAVEAAESPAGTVESASPAEAAVAIEAPESGSKGAD